MALSWVTLFTYEKTSAITVQNIAAMTHSAL